MLDKTTGNMDNFPVFSLHKVVSLLFLLSFHSFSTRKKFRFIIAHTISSTQSGKRFLLSEEMNKKYIIQENRKK